MFWYRKDQILKYKIKFRIEKSRTDKQHDILLHVSTRSIFTFSKNLLSRLNGRETDELL